LDGGSAHHEACTCRGRQNTEKRLHISVTQTGLEPTIPVLEQSKTIRALDHVANVTCMNTVKQINLNIITFSKYLNID